MNEERKQILEMLAAGKITPEEAERLLDKLSTGPPSAPASPGGTGPLKYLRVLVDSSDGDKVNVRVPLALIRTGIKLTTILPEDATEKMAAKGVNLGALGELDDAELYEALKELQVDVDSTDGDTVRVFCE